MGWPKGARKWSPQEILQDAKQAKELFRQRRLEEPKERYLEAFQTLEHANKKVVELLPGLLADPVDPRLITGPGRRSLNGAPVFGRSPDIDRRSRNLAGEHTCAYADRS